MNFDELKPGPELDKLVAEMVMEWKETTKRPALGHEYWEYYPTDEWLETSTMMIMNVADIPYFSSDIACAWQVVKEMVGREFEFTLSSPGSIQRVWDAHFFKTGTDLYKAIEHNSAYRDTPEFAICIAALKAVKNETG